MEGRTRRQSEAPCDLCGVAKLGVRGRARKTSKMSFSLAYDNGEYVGRRAEVMDAEAVGQLAAKVGAEERDGLYDVSAMIENALLSVVVQDRSEKYVSAFSTGGDGQGEFVRRTVGFAVFTPALSAGAIGGVDVAKRASALCVASGCVASNTVALTFEVATPDDGEDGRQGVMRESLAMCFGVNPFLEYVVCVRPEDAKPPAHFAPLGDVGGGSILYVASREAVMPKLKVRRAREEDHDDIIPVLEASGQVKIVGGEEGEESEGSFFLARLIAAQNEEDRVLVAESHAGVAGILALSSQLSVPDLNDAFDLEVYDNLLKDAREGDELPESNAFRVTMLSIDDSCNSRLLDMLLEAFDQFPDLDYCVLIVPHAGPECPYLDGIFTYVPPRQGLDAEGCLYVAHRDSLRPIITVRLAGLEIKSGADSSDVNDVEAMVAGFAEPQRSQVLDAFVAGCNNNKDASTAVEPFRGSVSVVAVVDGYVVGAAVLGDAAPGEVINLRGLFNLDDHVDLLRHTTPQFGVLQAFMLNPVFQARGRFVLQETMRLARKSLLLYKAYEMGAVPDVIDEMVPIPPRVAPDAGPCEFALYLTGMRLVTVPKTRVNDRVVVVGAAKSTTGLACLRSLLCDANIVMSSVTMVDSARADSSDVALKISRTAGVPNAAVRCGFAHKCARIAGDVDSIDRENRVLWLESGQGVPYDRLLVFGDLNHSPGPPLKGARGAHALGYYGCYDLCNQERFAEICASPMTVLYGGVMEAYLALTKLLDAGVAGENILMVNPPGTDRALFMSEDVIEIVDHVIKTLHVTVARLSLVKIEVEVVSNSVGAAVFEDLSNGEVSVETKAFVNCTSRSVDSRLFRVLDGAGLVFDGRLVVDSNFQTNDPNIFSGGAICKFSRQYGLGVYHEHLNGNEVGPMVAGSMLNSCFLGANGETLQKDATLPEFTRGASISVSLFGDKVYYTHAATAAIFSDEFIDEVPESRKFITLSRKHSRYVGQLTQIVTDGFGVIISAMAAGPKKVNALKLESLIGLHVSYLGDLPDRCRANVVGCLTEDFLNTTRGEVFVHDRFHEMRRILRQDVRESVDEALAALTPGVSGKSDTPEAEKERVARNAAMRAVFQHILGFVQTQSYDVPAHVIPMAFQTQPGLVK